MTVLVHPLVLHGNRWISTDKAFHHSKPQEVNHKTTTYWDILTVSKEGFLRVLISKEAPLRVLISKEAPLRVLISKEAFRDLIIKEAFKVSVSKGPLLRVSVSKEVVLISKEAFRVWVSKEALLRVVLIGKVVTQMQMFHFVALALLLRLTAQQVKYKYNVSFYY